MVAKKVRRGEEMKKKVPPMAMITEARMSPVRGIDDLQDNYIFSLEHLGQRVVFEMTPPAIGRSKFIEAAAKQALGALGRLVREATCDKEGHLPATEEYPGLCPRCFLVIDEAAWDKRGLEA